MELKDQILQTKERKKGFLKSMPDTMRTQINTYAKLDKLAKRFWIYPVAGLILSVAVYLVACLVATPENRWVVHAILAALWIVAGVFVGLRLKSAADKAKKAIMLGAPDYVEELNAINSKLDGLEKAEKARVEAEKQELKAKARAEAAQREAEAALLRQQQVVNSAPAVPPSETPVQPTEPPQE